MRLIDADKLKQHFAWWHEGGEDADRQAEIFEQIIDVQPTVEERKEGKWIVYKAPDRYHCGLVKCQFCGEELIAEADEYHFCPHCGARMEAVDAGDL